MQWLNNFSSYESSIFSIENVSLREKKLTTTQSESPVVTILEIRMFCGFIFKFYLRFSRVKGEIMTFADEGVFYLTDDRFGLNIVRNSFAELREINERGSLTTSVLQ